MTDGSHTHAEFDADARAAFGRLADILIPAGEGLPSASEAGVSGALLDRVLTARADLIDELRQLLERAKGREPARFVAELQENDASAFEVLATVVPGAYFMSDEVREKLGYHGQRAIPIEERDPPDYVEDGLLQSVLDRGPIYRSHP